jgi:hypothetical protein
MRVKGLECATFGAYHEPTFTTLPSPIDTSVMFSAGSPSFLLPTLLIVRGIDFEGFFIEVL